MSRWIRSTSDPEWRALFTGYERSAFRLEGQQYYGSPADEAALVSWVRGEPNDEPDPRDTRTRAQVALGRMKTNVRIVVEPPTLYTRWELTAYLDSVEAGEDIRVIAVPEGGRPPELPLYDYWLFDERDVWKMHYHENFRFAGAELLDGPEDLKQHLHWRDVALALSVPLGEYLADRQPDQEAPPG